MEERKVDYGDVAGGIEGSIEIVYWEKNVGSEVFESLGSKSFSAKGGVIEKRPSALFQPGRG
jgi:hypothetical protein